MEIKDIKKLIEFNKIKEAIDEMIGMTDTSLSSGLNQQSILLKFRLDKIDENDSDETEVDVAQDALNLLQRISGLTDGTGHIELHFPDTLVKDDSYIFIDRREFRNILREALQKNEPKMIFVKGNPRSGMSYLEMYLLHLSSRSRIYELVPIEVAGLLDDPFPSKGVRLAQYMSLKLTLGEALEKEESDQFKFLRFMKSLQGNLAVRPTIPIFFLHDFHRMTVVPPDMYKFILSIALELRNQYPRSIFIIAGMNCEELPNWNTDLIQICPVYTIENIDKQHIQDCLSSIFYKYKEQIYKLNGVPLTEEEFMEGMLITLIPDETKIDLAMVNSILTTYLGKLKKLQ